MAVADRYSMPGSSRGRFDAFFHKPFAHPMQGQHVLLLDAPYRDKAHAGTSDCLADRLRMPQCRSGKAPAAQ